MRILNFKNKSAKSIKILLKWKFQNNNNNKIFNSNMKKLIDLKHK